MTPTSLCCASSNSPCEHWFTLRVATCSQPSLCATGNTTVGVMSYADGMQWPPELFPHRTTLLHPPLVPCQKRHTLQWRGNESLTDQPRPLSEKSKQSLQRAHNVVYLTFTAVCPRMNAHSSGLCAKIFHSDASPSTLLIAISQAQLGNEEWDTLPLRRNVFLLLQENVTTSLCLWLSRKKRWPLFLSENNILLNEENNATVRWS